MLIVTVCVMLLFAAASVTAETTEFYSSFVSGTSASGDYGRWAAAGGRLFQRDTDEPLAKINFKADQYGVMEYTFDVRYEGGGLSDRMGGFGIQIFVDDAYNGKSWGNGESYLLWLNYDENPSYGGSGFRAQVYKSTGNSKMEILKGYDVALNPRVLTVKNLDLVVPVKIQVDGRSGLVKVWDPSRPGTYVRFYLDDSPGRGRYFSLRTNSLAASFDNVKVSAVD